MILIKLLLRSVNLVNRGCLSNTFSCLFTICFMFTMSFVSPVPDGLRFDSSVQTPLVSAGEKQVLSLESPTKTLFMNAANGIRMTSVANDMTIGSLYDITMTSKKGKVCCVSDITLTIYVASKQSLYNPTSY